MGPVFCHGTALFLWDRYFSMGPLYYTRTDSSNELSQSIRFSYSSPLFSLFLLLTLLVVITSADLPVSLPTLSDSDKERNVC